MLSLTLFILLLEAVSQRRGFRQTIPVMGVVAKKFVFAKRFQGKRVVLSNIFNIFVHF